MRKKNAERGRESVREVQVITPVHSRRKSNGRKNKWRKTTFRNVVVCRPKKKKKERKRKKKLKMQQAKMPKR